MKILDYINFCLFSLQQFGVGGGDGGADIVNGLGLLTMLLFAVMAMFI